MLADHDVAGTPAARKMGYQIGANTPVKLKKEAFVERAAIVVSGHDRALQRLDALG